MGTEEGASHSTFGVREEITASTDSPTLGLPIGMLLPLNLAIALSEHTFLLPEYHSQMPAPAASGPPRSWDPSAAVEEESSRAA